MGSESVNPAPRPQPSLPPRLHPARRPRLILTQIETPAASLPRRGSGSAELPTPSACCGWPAATLPSAPSAALHSAPATFRVPLLRSEPEGARVAPHARVQPGGP